MSTLTLTQDQISSIQNILKSIPTGLCTSLKSWKNKSNLDNMGVGGLIIQFFYIGYFFLVKQNNKYHRIKELQNVVYILYVFAKFVLKRYMYMLKHIRMGTKLYSTLFKP